MNFPSFAPLTDSDLDFLDEILLKYGHDDSILSVSELDGFLTAIVSGPEMIPPSQWVPELWGGATNEPEWESETEIQRFMRLVMQHMNSIASALMDSPHDYVALFQMREFDGKEVTVAEEWCFGYMRGVDLGNWPALPEEIDTWLGAIALHGREDNFAVMETLSLEEHQQTVADIEPAVRKLHAYWLARRTAFPPVVQTPVRTEPKVGRNDPCPCGSGRKFKQCCLH